MKANLAKRIVFTLTLLLVLTCSKVYANGILVPTMKGVAPLSIKYQSVDIKITSNVAKTKVEQVFYNSTNRRLEANYVFPLPEGASISDFAMYINGKRMSGELVEKGKARAIYEGIVRKMKDPGLLEYMGNNLFRARIFPIEPNSTQKVELEYSEILAFDNNVYSYVYPLKTGMKAARTLEDFTVSVDLKSKVALKNIYSPSHNVGISRRDDYHAVIGFEENRVYLDKDFKLFYTVSEDDIGLNLFSYNANGRKDDGYFMVMLTPKLELKEGEVNKKNIVFTVDTSGSMAGKKMRNTKKALVQGLNTLNKHDRFNIVRFSTDVQLFRKGLVPATERNIYAALQYADMITASGGTAIDYALNESLKLFDTPKGTNILVFMTDGLPTVGTRDVRMIINNAKSNNKNTARLFSFGVGHDVNTVLLDAIASDGRGMSEYLKANEEIEIKLSHFFNKVANPVLSNITIDFGDVTVNRNYPRATPDIFKGDDLVILGRYKKHGPTAIRLKGMMNGKEREYVYEGTFTKDSTDHDFIPRLWAVRRVGYLLEEIKLHGEAKELKDEVITLSKQYGIMTPYTSYLVLENEQQYAQHGIKRPDRKQIAKKKTPKPKSRPRTFYLPTQFDPVLKDRERRKTATAPPAGAYEDLDERIEGEESDVVVGGSGGIRGSEEKPASAPENGFFQFFGKSKSSVDTSASRAPADLYSKMDRIAESPRSSTEFNARVMKQESGESAVEVSKGIRMLKENKAVGDDMIAMSNRQVKGRTFNYVDSYWTDTKFKVMMKGLKIKYLSNAYFNLLKAMPQLKDTLALGEKIRLVINGKSLIIDTEGLEEMDVDKIKEYYKK